MAGESNSPRILAQHPCANWEWLRVILAAVQPKWSPQLAFLDRRGDKCEPVDSSSLLALAKIRHSHLWSLQYLFRFVFTLENGGSNTTVIYIGVNTWDAQILSKYFYFFIRLPLGHFFSTLFSRLAMQNNFSHLLNRFSTYFPRPSNILKRLHSYLKIFLTLFIVSKKIAYLIGLRLAAKQLIGMNNISR